MKTFDFSRSYFRFRVDLAQQPMITLSHKMPTTVNNVRINLECRCAITPTSGPEKGKTTVYVLGASCKTERVGAPDHLWLEPNADFAPILSTEDFLLIKSWQKNDMGVMRNPASLGVQPERQIGKVKEAWVGVSIELPEVGGVELKDINAIIEGIRGTNYLVSHTEYEQNGYHVAIDHPVKTINYSERENVFQTDTGPILLPDLSPERSKPGDPFIGRFDLAFSAFNAPTFAEFIVNKPTPLAPGLSVNHYSKPVRIDGCKNMLIEVK